jgi:leader peptidase (prepilin peptidase) / N-methyltransferase
VSLLPLGYWLTVAFCFGAVVGSFLNVVIWRLPRGRSLSHPGSHCPNCQRPIRPWENIPVISFLALRARCAGCRKPISWRYPGVELLTALLFTAVVWHFGATVTSLAYCLAAAALVAAFFIDLELFLIPNELNTFALLTGFGLDAIRIAQLGKQALVWGWLPRSVLGAVVCAGVFVGIQLLGYGLFRKESMGEGDVKLARAIGAILPLSQALVSFFLAIAVGAVVGVAKVALSRQPAEDTAASAEDNTDDEDEEELPYDTAYIVKTGLGYLFFYDLVEEFVSFIRRLGTGEKRVPLTEEEDDFVVTPTHIPFGPFMVVGFFLAAFCGDRLIDWYVTWTGLK